MLLGRTGLTLSGVGLQSGGDLATGVRGIDHVVNPVSYTHLTLPTIYSV